jgi:hypothetical protein
MKSSKNCYFEIFRAVDTYDYYIENVEQAPVRDTAQENVMNAHEETRLFLVVINQPKKYKSNQY